VPHTSRLFIRDCGYDQRSPDLLISSSQGYEWISVRTFRCQSPATLVGENTDGDDLLPVDNDGTTSVNISVSVAAVTATDGMNVVSVAVRSKVLSIKLDSTSFVVETWVISRIDVVSVFSLTKV